LNGVGKNGIGKGIDAYQFIYIFFGKHKSAFQN
jgi:hypothetical protein